jgi:putative flippase GtrA
MKFKTPLRIFAKAQASAFIGGLTDYLIMIACTELLLIHYTISIAIGGIIGAVVNFSINRHWTYKAHNTPVGKQILKFIIIVAGSILLKSSGTWLLTTFLRIDYKISRIIIEIIISLGFNFVLQKYWVFKKKPGTLTSDNQHVIEIK